MLTTTGPGSVAFASSARLAGSSPARFEPYLPQLVREWHAGADTPDWRSVPGTLVSLDISGFTRLSERLAGTGRAGAEELIRLLGSCFDGLISVAEIHGGDVLKFRGDALLVFYSGSRHEARACRSAAEMQRFMDGIGRMETSLGTLRLRMSTGIHSGLCHFFMLSSSHRELVVTGPAASITVALEKEARAGQVLVSEATAAALDARWLGERRSGARLLRHRRVVSPAQEDGTDERTDAEAPPPAADRSRAQKRADADELGQYLPPAVRELVAAGGGEGEFRLVTAAFVRFHGTDRLLDEGRPRPDRVHERLGELAAAVGEACAALGVVWLESDIAQDGGALYLTAGAPTGSGADEERMLRAVRSIADGVAGLPLSIGVSRGIVFTGDIGAAGRRTYAVTGSPSNVAARLMQRARRREVLVTADVLKRSRTRFHSRALDPMAVKGYRAPVLAHRLGPIDRRRPDGAGVQLPFVGRERELGVLGGALQGASAGEGRLVELVAEPGMGKSRLVEELVQMSGGRALPARAEQYESATPYFVFRSILRTLAGIATEATPEPAGVALAAWVDRVAPDLAPWLPLIAIAADASVERTPEVENTAPEFRRARLERAVTALLRAVVPSATVLVFEDAQWMDEASSGLLAQLAAGVASTPWLICVTRRPAGRSYAADASASGIELTLEPLGPDASAALAAAAAGGAALPDAALATLANRSGGNPLFLRELVATLHEEEAIGELPETVESLISARVDTLRLDDRRLLRSAAAAGSVLDLDVLAEVLGDDLLGVTDRASWDRLEEFIEWEASRTLRFRHDLFRAAAYEGLSYRRRREIHRRLAHAIERRAGADADEQAGILSLHFLRAGEYEPAWRYAAEAGRRAQSKFANIAAAELYERALEAAGQLRSVDPAAVAGVSEALGDVSELAARYAAAGGAYRAARRLVRHHDRLGRARLLHKEGVLSERAGRYTAALRWYGRALSALDELEGAKGAASLRAQIELAYSGVLYRQGRYARSARWAQRAADNAEASGDRRSLAHAYYLLDAAYTDLGRPESALYRERALPIFEEVGDLVRQGNVLNNLGIDAYYEGRWTEALDLYRRSGEVSQRAGDVVTSATQSNNEAEVLSDQGRLAEAEERLRDALRVWRAAKYSVGIALATSNLGRAAARAGRLDEADALFGEALEQFSAIGAESFVLETQARIAESLVLQGRPGPASEVLSSAFPARQVGGVSVLEAFVERLRGYVHLQAGRSSVARDHLEASLRIGRSLKADFEVALTLRALAELEDLARGAAGHEQRRESEAILERLGVASVPTVPLAPDDARTPSKEALASSGGAAAVEGR